MVKINYSLASINNVKLHYLSLIGINMRHEGRRVIRLNDKTDHGGQVISASSGTVVLGIEAALADDMTFCPKCKGTFPIKPDGVGAKHIGRPYAYDNDLTACGAKVISSL